MDGLMEWVVTKLQGKAVRALQANQHVIGLPCVNNHRLRPGDIVAGEV